MIVQTRIQGTDLQIFVSTTKLKFILNLANSENILDNKLKIYFYYFKKKTDYEKEYHDYQKYNKTFVPFLKIPLIGEGFGHGCACREERGACPPKRKFHRGGDGPSQINPQIFSY